jgi:hypothetical protein
MTHDYKRNGTTTLFAAIELGRGEVIARTGANMPNPKRSCQNEEGSMDSAAEPEPSVGLGLDRPPYP